MITESVPSPHITHGRPVAAAWHIVSNCREFGIADAVRHAPVCRRTPRRKQPSQADAENRY